MKARCSALRYVGHMQTLFEELLTTPAAAALLGLSPRTLEGWRRTGEGPAFVRLGRRRVAYRRSALDSWLDRG
jgi:predicted DNA-binding transcriptional regulator AlpA